MDRATTGGWRKLAEGRASLPREGDKPISAATSDHPRNPKAGANDQTRIRLRRIFSSKSVMAWAEILKDAVCARLKIRDEEERVRPFYRELSEAEWAEVKDTVSRLLTWAFWAAPADSEIDSQLANNKTALKAWFKDKGLTTGYLMGASE